MKSIFEKGGPDREKGGAKTTPWPEPGKGKWDPHKDKNLRNNQKPQVKRVQEKGGMWAAVERLVVNEHPVRGRKGKSRKGRAKIRRLRRPALAVNKRRRGTDGITSTTWTTVKGNKPTQDF